MATDVRGHTVPGSGDAPSRAGILAGFKSVNSWKAVADTTARATYLTDLAGEGITVSTSDPARVIRADAGATVEHEYTVDGTNWRVVRAEQGWTTYSPTHSNVTVGNGTQVAKYFIRDKIATVHYSLTFGSTTAITGTANFGLPVTAVDTLLGVPGNAYCVDSSASGASSRESMSIQVGSTATQVILRNDTTDLLTNTAPWTWGTGDTIKFTAQIPVA